MDIFEAIESRRSVKHYDADHRLTEEEERKLLSAAMLAPTAFNIQHWRFVVVKDEAKRQALRAAAYNQAQVTDASMLVVLCADLKAWKKEPERYWRNSPPETGKALVGMMTGFYKHNEQMERDEAVRSSGFAAQNLMLAARGLGYDTCAMDGFDFKKAAEIINLPDDHILTMFVVVGKALTPAYGRPGQLAYDEVVIEDSF